MRRSSKTLAMLAVVALIPVVAIGAEEAGAVSSHNSGSSPTTVGDVTTSGRGGMLRATPLVAPLKNVAYVYSTSTTGGTGLLHFHLSNPPAGTYAVSFSATFSPEGTPSAPETFGCWVTQRHYLLVQATATSTSESGFWVGVNGSRTTTITPTTFFTVGCGVVDKTKWRWGNEPLQVTMTRLDGIRNRVLRPRQGAGLGAGAATTG